MSRTAEHFLPECWVADTGCGHDLLAAKWVRGWDQNKMRESESPLSFSGVGGKKPANMAHRGNPANNALVDPLVLDSKPGILRRV
ncbi:hypothetical protein N9L68_00645 [bacterium]|nr:hypothetical protein [bacterium]